MLKNNEENNFFNNMTKQRLLNMISVNATVAIKFMLNRQKYSKLLKFQKFMKFNNKNKIDNNNNNNDLFKVKNVDYFDLKYFKDFNVYIISVEKHVYYRDVFVFIDKLKNLIKQKSNKILKSLMLTCFRNKILK